MLFELTPQRDSSKLLFLVNGVSIETSFSETFTCRGLLRLAGAFKVIILRSRSMSSTVSRFASMGLNAVSFKS